MSRSNDVILNHLRECPHTSDEMTTKTGLTEIAGRICELRARGFEIHSQLIRDNSRGFERRIARYSLIREVTK